MKCSKCGEEINANQGFCLKCGNPVQMEPDFNSIEADLASSVLEFMDEDDSTDKVELSDEEPMITVDVPYEEIDMELKMVDINREKNITKTSTNTQSVKKQENANNAKNKVADSKKKKSKKPIIILCVVAVILLIAGITALVMFISNKNSMKTYEGNFDKAVEALDEKLYDEALTYALKAVNLSTSDKEELAARKILDSIYIASNIVNDEYASNLKEMILLGEKTSDNYVTLVDYYYKNEKYLEINEIVKTITSDDIYDALTDYIPNSPRAEQESGGYAGYVVVTLVADEGCKIFYTLNSDDSLDGGVEYVDGVKILGEESAKLTCYAEDENGIKSRTATYEYTIIEGELEQPNVSPSSGSYSEPLMIEVEVPEGSKAYYTFDGTDPTSESTEYTEPVAMPRGTSKFKVIIYDSYGLPSAITTESYNLNITRCITINESIALIEDLLIEEERMDEEGNTVYGTMRVAYEQTAVIDIDEYYIIIATEYSDDESALTATIYGINTYNGSVCKDIINAEGEYVILETESESETE